MITIANADKALKTYYLDAISAQLDSISPFYAAIDKHSAEVYGKEVKVAVVKGDNSRVVAGAEDGDLPAAGQNRYINLTSTLKNIYGTIDISDKALRAAKNSEGAFVDLVNAEMEGLISSAKVNFSRMLYGDGTGFLCNFTSVTDGKLGVSGTNNLIEGMMVDVYTTSAGVDKLSDKIIAIDRVNNKVTLQTNPTVTTGYLYNQGSRNKELTGLKAIFSSSGDLYGIPRSSIPSLVPRFYSNVGALSDVTIQEHIDRVENFSNCKIDFIALSNEAKYSYLDFLASYKRNVDYMTTDTGFKAISFGGVPMVFERFVDSGEMYMMDTSTLKLHQLCDWRFLETENGNILHQAQDKPVYSATLVKYCDLICNKPNSLVRLMGITRE